MSDSTQAANAENTTSAAGTENAEAFVVQDQHSPVPPKGEDTEFTTLDQHSPAPPALGADALTTMDQHSPAPPALGRDSL